MSSTDPLKVVVRLLPPEITDEEFQSTLSQVHKDRIKWSSFQPGKRYKGEAKPSLNSRCYLQFGVSAQAEDFITDYHGHQFVDGQGETFRAVACISPYQKAPRKAQKDSREGTIEDDSTYKDFLERLQAKVQFEAPPDPKVLLKPLDYGDTPLLNFMKTRAIERKARWEKRQNKKWYPDAVEAPKRPKWQCSECNTSKNLEEDPDDRGVFYCTYCWESWEHASVPKAKKKKKKSKDEAYEEVVEEAAAEEESSKKKKKKQKEREREKREEEEAAPSKAAEWRAKDVSSSWGEGYAYEEETDARKRRREKKKKEESEAAYGEEETGTSSRWRAKKQQTAEEDWTQESSTTSWGGEDKKRRQHKATRSSHKESKQGEEWWEEASSAPKEEKLSSLGKSSRAERHERSDRAEERAQGGGRWRAKVPVEEEGASGGPTSGGSGGGGREEKARHGRREKAAEGDSGYWAPKSSNKTSYYR